MKKILFHRVAEKKKKNRNLCRDRQNRDLHGMKMMMILHVLH